MAEDNKLKLNKEQLDKVAGGSHGGFLWILSAIRDVAKAIIVILFLYGLKLIT